MSSLFGNGRGLGLFPRARSARRPARPATVLTAESLEPRTMLTAHGMMPGSETIGWLGRTVEVQPGGWVGRTVDTAVAASLAGMPGWKISPLGEGFFSLAAPGAAVAEVLGWAAQWPVVASIEPDFVIAPQSFPNDPAFGSLWGLRNVGQAGGVAGADINAAEAWSMTTGSRSVVVAVIDTGIDWTHRDLAANIWRNPGEIPGDGLDNDGNGFIDDWIGWDFANHDADPMDDNGHGTHVAGTIGAVGDDGAGTVGVNWQVSLMPLKFLSASGRGSTSAAIAAINYATRMKRDFGINIVATNNSWGGGNLSATLRDAIAAGGSQGILFVTAAGNDATNIDALPSYPASVADPAVIAVAATDHSNRLASFSNYGLASVDIAAPGVGIISTVPGNATASYSGTSMAAPHVTGVVALVAAANPAAPAAEIRAAILATATPVSSLARRVAAGGVLNAAAAVALIQGAAPGAGAPRPAAEPVPIVVDAGQVARGALRVPTTAGSVAITGIIGDSRFGSHDVDMVRVVVQAGQLLVIDVAGVKVGDTAPVDSYLRVFNTAGRQVRANHNFAGSRDSRVVIRPLRPNVFFVGVSGAGNTRYNPQVARNTRPGSTGGYELTLSFSRPPGSRQAADAIELLGIADVTRHLGQTHLFLALAAEGFMPAVHPGVPIRR